MSAWPQYLMLVLIGMALIHTLSDEVSRDDVEHRKIGVVVSLIVTALFTWVLWMGGFWAPLGWLA